MASRTIRRRLRPVTASAASPNDRSSRALTSMNTSVGPSRAMMSNSPPRRRYRLARIAYPRRSSSRHARSSPAFPKITLARDMALRQAIRAPLAGSLPAPMLIPQPDHHENKKTRKHEKESSSQKAQERILLLRVFVLSWFRDSPAPLPGSPFY